MIHSTLDDALFNSAYLSELWAIQDLLRLKEQHVDLWTPEREQQLNDEIRHANIILKALRETGSIVIKDLKYSMQERLYRPFCDLSATASLSEAAVIHNMTERRAVWIYKTYTRVGSVSLYKSISMQICKDEEGHFDINKDQLKPSQHSFIQDSCYKIDQFVFNEYLPSKYGKVSFRSKSFWDDYYQGASFD